MATARRTHAVAVQDTDQAIPRAVPPVPAAPERGAWTAAALPRTKGLMAACHVGVAAHSLTEGGRDAPADRPGPLGHIPEPPLPDRQVHASRVRGRPDRR